MHHMARQLYKPHLDFFSKKIQDTSQSNNWINEVQGICNLSCMTKATLVAIQHEVVRIQNTKHRIWIQHDL